MTMLLQGRVALSAPAHLRAAARGIGMATARLFVEHGARVALLDLDEARCASRRERSARSMSASAAT